MLCQVSSLGWYTLCFSGRGRKAPFFPLCSRKGAYQTSPRKLVQLNQRDAWAMAEEGALRLFSFPKSKESLPATFQAFQPCKLNYDSRSVLHPLKSSECSLMWRNGSFRSLQIKWKYGEETYTWPSSWAIVKAVLNPLSSLIEQLL